MRYCVWCGCLAKSRSCSHCGSDTSLIVFNRILDADNNILYEGIDKQQADILWELAKHNHTLVKRVEYAYQGRQDEKSTPD